MRVGILAVLLLTVPLSAQRYDDTITVNVVDVPVYVERFGRPVTGLTRDDFELVVNGKPHPIEYFETRNVAPAEEDTLLAGPVLTGSVLPRQSVPVDRKRRRLTVLVFDAAASRYALQRARKAGARYVEGGAPGDTFAVATVGWSGVLFLVPFTNDRVAVQRAIATLRPSAARDPFRVATLEVERGIPGDGHPQAGPPAIAGWFSGAAIDMSTTDNDFEARGLIENLSQLADRLAPLEGLKEVVLLSEGRGSGSSGAMTEAGVRHTMIRMHQRYRAAGVILNGVDISTPRAPGGAADDYSSGRVSDSAPYLLTSPFLWSLALDTGGIATSSLPELQKRHRAGYVIGFRAPASRSKNNSIRIYVRSRPFLTEVRYRKAYSLERENRDDGLFLADTILNDIPQNGVTLDLAVKGTWVAASIPGVELLSYASEGPRLNLDVYFYIFDEQQRPVAWNRMQIAVDLEKGREFLTTSPYTMRQEFVLDPGRYVAKALVRIAGTDRVGFERTELEVAQ